MFTLIADAAEGKIRPTMALYGCRMIGMYLTPFEPMRGFVDAMIAREGQDGVLSLSLAHCAVTLHCNGIDIVVNSLRGQVFSPQVFSKLGIDPLQRRLLIVKSTQHFYAGFAPIAAHIIYMAAPGAIAPLFREIPSGSPQIPLGG